MEAKALYFKVRLGAEQELRASVLQLLRSHSGKQKITNPQLVRFA